MRSILVRRSSVRAASGLAVFGLALTLVASQPISAQGIGLVPSKPQVAENYGRSILSFEANRGQTDARVRFQARGLGYGIFLTDKGAVLALSKAAPEDTQVSDTKATAFKRATMRPHKPTRQHTDVVRLELSGARVDVSPEGQGWLAGKANYFLGNDPTMWHSDVPTCARVRYAHVYDGVDLVYYGNQRQLEYDFVVAPHADPAQIRLRFAGARALSVTRQGDLQIDGRHGSISFQRPVLYQELNGRRQPVEGSFALAANRTVAFQVGRYNPDLPLTIDPVLVYSTYLGGSVTDSAYAIAVDSSGSAYVAGSTQSTNFPVTSAAFQNTNKASNGGATAFITKLDPTGTTVIYSTYLGGSQGDGAAGIAVDSSGNAYVTGATGSTDFPVTSGAFQTTKKSTGVVTAFVTKLNPTGSALVYSTYLGGSHGDGIGGPQGDAAAGVAVDSAGDAYVTGSTGSVDFPVTTGAFQITNRALFGTAFVTELNPTGTALVYSTYLGGEFSDAANGIAVDPSGSAYVTGSTQSYGFPVTNGALQASSTSADVGDGFVTKLNPTGSDLVFSTYLGGRSCGFLTYIYGLICGTGPAGIAVDSSGGAYVTGWTEAIDFPVTNGAFQTTDQTIYGDPYSNVGTAFVTKFDPAGPVVYSTFLGGPTTARATAIAADSSGNAYVTGYTSYSYFPITCGGVFQASNNGSTNAFVTELNSTGSALIYSTYLGGSAGDAAYAIAVDSSDDAYVAGHALSSNFPVTSGAFQTTPSGQNAFVTKFDFSDGTLASSSTSLVFLSDPDRGYGGNVNLAATVTAPSGCATPTGTVAFYANGMEIGSGLLNASGVATSSTALAADNYSYTAMYEGSEPYAGSTSLPILGAVIPAVITVKPLYQRAIYGQPYPTFTYVITGLKYGQTASVLSSAPVLTTTVGAGAGVGMYPINIEVSGITAPNYAVVAGPPAALIITPANLQVKALGTSVEQGAPIPVFSYELSGLTNGDTDSVVSGSPTITTTATEGSPPGTYPILVNVSGMSAANYKIAAGPNATLTIKP
jgi:hypothetical protein